MGYTAEQFNLLRLCHIIFDIVPEGLRTIFKQEWDKITHRAWKDTYYDFKLFLEMESPYKRKKYSNRLKVMSSGDRKDWDSSCLIYAILYSDTMREKISLVAMDNVVILRDILNEMKHKHTKLNDREFHMLVDLENATRNEIPIEIALRGPKAIGAFEKALLNGNVKLRRLLVMLIGQSGAGKTSLLKSFRGEKFDPNVDSTKGVVLNRCCCKLLDEAWTPDSAIKDQISFEANMSKSIAKKHVDQAKKTIQTYKRSKVKSDIKRKEMYSLRETSGSEKKRYAVENPVDHHPRNLNVSSQSAENSEISLSLNSASQNAENDEVPLSFDSAETKDELFKRANDTLTNPKEANTDDIICTVLDIGGQPVYDVIHPLFLSRKGVFILTHSLENDTNEESKVLVRNGTAKRKLDNNCYMTNMDQLWVWLSFVGSLNAITNKRVPVRPRVSSNYRLMPNKLPPVFLACTHKDEALKKRRDPEEMARQILKYLEGHPSREHLVSGFYLIDNTVSGSSEDKEVIKLRKDVCSVAKSLPHMNGGECIIPTRWLAFEKELKSLVQKKKRYLPLEEAKRIASKCKVVVDVENSDEFITLVSYLHDIREIIYFEGTNTVFTDVEWLINMIRKVITVEPIENWPSEPSLRASWKKLEYDGILDEQLLNHVWSEVTVEKEVTTDDLLTIMEIFSLVYRWKIEDKRYVFLVPAMLTNASSQDISDLLKDQMPPLIVHFQSSHLPLGIFPRIQVKFAEFCNRKWPQARQPKFYHNFCRFYRVGKDASFDLVLTSDIRAVYIGTIHAKEAETTDNQKLGEFCQEILEFLKTTLVVQNFPWIERMDYTLCIRCSICQPSCKNPHFPGCARDECVHLISEREILNTKEEDLFCLRNPFMSDVSIPYDHYFHWFPKPRKQIPFKPVPMDISTRTALNISEEMKRWLVVGIAMMKVLLPTLRRFMQERIRTHYHRLKDRNNIHTQTRYEYLVEDGVYELNYGNINGNSRWKDQEIHFEYKVKSEVDLAKLYCLDFMAKFSGFDESCDLSAVLRILGMSGAFLKKVRRTAHRLREDVRNEWGHCNLTEWNEEKFQGCFQVMHSMVETLELAADQEEELLHQLEELENTGVERFCFGSPVDAALLNLAQNDVTLVQREVQYLRQAERKQIEEFDRISCVLEGVFKNLENLETRMTNLEQRVMELEINYKK
ncbi:uncharacterized protein LOC110245892 isoform X1 [Exaiptasia diaphana]|uniref:COR domain-containing protein n=1 Tax=Exaiptasia diaphana TaxID=2652724 RepID=A0A913XQY6_EXADI|nr:uncharacterized protein LOC110245892 isoform X1 [Exaiptasia diaphana]